MFRDGLWRVDPGLGDGRKGAWLLPVLLVLILWVILQLSKHRGLLWDSLIIVIFFFFKTQIHLLLKELPVRACLTHQWGCRTLSREVRKKTVLQILNTQCLCPCTAGEERVLSSVASLCSAVSDIQFLHYGGSWRLVVSCSSSLSKHENLVLRVVLGIGSYP